MAAKFTITELSNELEIKIRHSKRSDMPVASFLVVWLTGWLFGEIFALSMLFGKGTPVMIRVFMVIWVIPWSVGGAFAFASLLKMIGGHENVKVSHGMLEVSRFFVLFKLTKRYDIFRISDLHTLPKNPRKFDFVNSGVLQFRYENKDIRFGAGLTPEEKKEVLSRLKEHRDFSARNFR